MHQKYQSKDTVVMLGHPTNLQNACAAASKCTFFFSLNIAVEDEWHLESRGLYATTEDCNDIFVTQDPKLSFCYSIAKPNLPMLGLLY